MIFLREFFFHFIFTTGHFCNIFALKSILQKHVNYGNKILAKIIDQYVRLQPIFKKMSF